MRDRGSVAERSTLPVPTLTTLVSRPEPGPTRTLPRPVPTLLYTTLLRKLCLTFPSVNVLAEETNVVCPSNRRQEREGNWYPGQIYQRAKVERSQREALDKPGRKTWVLRAAVKQGERIDRPVDQEEGESLVDSGE